MQTTTATTIGKGVYKTSAKQDLSCDWAELNFTNTVSTFEDVANQPIWLNSNIKCHKKLL